MSIITAQTTRFARDRSPAATAMSLLAAPRRRLNRDPSPLSRDPDPDSSSVSSGSSTSSTLSRTSSATTLESFSSAKFEASSPTTLASLDIDTLDVDTLDVDTLDVDTLDVDTLDTLDTLDAPPSSTSPPESTSLRFSASLLISRCFRLVLLGWAIVLLAHDTSKQHRVSNHFTRCVAVYGSAAVVFVHAIVLVGQRAVVYANTSSLAPVSGLLSVALTGVLAISQQTVLWGVYLTHKLALVSGKCAIVTVLAAAAVTVAAFRGLRRLWNNPRARHYRRRLGQKLFFEFAVLILNPAANILLLAALWPGWLILGLGIWGLRAFTGW